MRLYFLKTKDGYEQGKHYFVELSLGRRFWKEGTAIPYQQYLDEKYEKELAEKEKKKPVVKKKTATATRATSKKAASRNKATN